MVRTNCSFPIRHTGHTVTSFPVCSISLMVADMATRGKGVGSCNYFSCCCYHEFWHHLRPLM
ncbi:MAG TPA: hypothetical protein PKZ72_04130, partial [Saprospiraceae bacterium]|nr:hypothetical protein [Saprospiraceae bacterium]